MITTPMFLQRKVDSINTLSDTELLLEIERGRNSRFKESLMPILKLVAKKRDDVTEASRREEKLSVARESYVITNLVLELVVLANKKVGLPRVRSAIEVLIAIVAALLGWIKG